MGNWVLISENPYNPFTEEVRKTNRDIACRMVSRFAIFLRNNDKQSRLGMDSLIRAVQANNNAQMPWLSNACRSFTKDSFCADATCKLVWDARKSRFSMNPQRIFLQEGSLLLKLSQTSFIPSSREILGFQPKALRRSLLMSLRNVPSGFERSGSIFPS